MDRFVIRKENRWSVNSSPHSVRLSEKAASCSKINIFWYDFRAKKAMLYCIWYQSP